MRRVLCGKHCNSEEGTQFWLMTTKWRVYGARIFLASLKKFAGSILLVARAIWLSSVKRASASLRNQSIPGHQRSWLERGFSIYTWQEPIYLMGSCTWKRLLWELGTLTNLISGLAGLCVYLFYPNLFPSKSASFPPKNNQNAPLSKPVIAIAVHMMFTLRWLLSFQFRVKIWGRLTF